MIGLQFFREEAVLRHAQPDSLDGLPRVDLPHDYLASWMAGSLVLISIVLLTACQTLAA